MVFCFLWAFAFHCFPRRAGCSSEAQTKRDIKVVDKIWTKNLHEKLTFNFVKIFENFKKNSKSYEQIFRAAWFMKKAFNTKNTDIWVLGRKFCSYWRKSCILSALEHHPKSLKLWGRSEFALVTNKMTTLGFLFLLLSWNCYSQSPFN